MIEIKTLFLRCRLLWNKINGMKKLTVLFIIFLFLFNLSSGVFAGIFETETGMPDINSFDVFVLEHTQKTFSNTLSCDRETNTENDTRSDRKDLSFYNNNDLIFQSSSMFSFYEYCGVKTAKLNSTYNFHKNDINLSGRHKLFYERYGGGVTGITEYKTKFNSYIAVALFDAGNFVFIYINKG